MSLKNEKECLYEQERRHDRVVRASQLWCRRSQECRRFKPEMDHPTTGKLSLPPTCFESGKDKERDALRLGNNSVFCLLPLL